VVSGLTGEKGAVVKTDCPRPIGDPAIAAKVTRDLPCRSGCPTHAGDHLEDIGLNSTIF